MTSKKAALLGFLITGVAQFAMYAAFASFVMWENIFSGDLFLVRAIAGFSILIAAVVALVIYVNHEKRECNPQAP